MYKYIFGPVISRRLGTSLGIDLVRMKTCTLNCAYCECGKTTRLTTERREYVPVDVVIDEIRQFMDEAETPPDYVTFSGSGEPTLNSRIGDVIQAIKQSYPTQNVAVLTNSTLLHLKEVQDALIPADLVLPSLDAVSLEAFEHILSPHPDVTPELVLKGITEFSARYTGRLVIEIFIVPGVNDTDEELSLLRDACQKIMPDGIQINYLDRPGAFDWVKPATAAELDHVERALAGLPVQIIKRPDYGTMASGNISRLEQKILSTVERRPSTLDDLVFSLGMQPAELRTFIDRLVDEQKLVCERGKRGFFYRKG
ncbi:MAG: radical SAM protein [Spirochaetota bacterium]